MGIAIVVVIGALAGLVFRWLVPGAGLTAGLVLGAMGSVLGGLISGLLAASTAFFVLTPLTLLAAAIGAMVVLGILALGQRARVKP